MSNDERVGTDGRDGRDRRARTGLTVVLGWDGLDHELAVEYGLADAFGAHTRELETFDNEALGKPHTYEVWPSIVTGVTPEVHGIYAKTADAGTDWADPRIALAARLANGVVPQSVRAAVGRRLRNRGASLDFRGIDYYRETGVETAFDGRRALPLAVPNCRTPADDELDLVFDRGAQLGQYLHVESGPDGGTRHRPKVPLPRLEQRLVGEAAKKLGVVRAALQREYDLVFVWLGYLDTAGHLAPTIEEPGWQARAYERAARWTREVRDELTGDDVLVCVSDHGLRGGSHTHSAFYGTDDERSFEGVESVLDVKRALDRVTPRSGAGGEPAVRDAYRRDAEVTRRDADAVRGQLEDLGYL